MSFKGRAICTVHDEIKSALKTLYKMKIKDYETLSDYKDDVDWELSKIEDLVDEAKEMGQSMEDCIVGRRTAIEEAVTELQTIVIANLKESL